MKRCNIGTLLSTTAGLKLPKRLELAYINTARRNRRGAIDKEPCINMLSINTHPARDTCLLAARGYSSRAKLGPQEVSRRFKARTCGERAGQRGPRWLSELSERRLKDDTHVLGAAHVCHWLFVGVNLEAHQGKQCHRTQAHSPI